MTNLEQGSTTDDFQDTLNQIDQLNQAQRRSEGTPDGVENETTPDYLLEANSVFHMQQSLDSFGSRPTMAEAKAVLDANRKNREEKIKKLQEKVRNESSKR